MEEDTKNLNLILVVCCVSNGLKDGLHSSIILWHWHCFFFGLEEEAQ